MKTLIRIMTAMHEKCISTRRIKKLAPTIASILPPHSKVLDIGTGNGRLARAILELRPDVSISGMDIRASTSTVMDVETFDGAAIPKADGSWDVCMASDVLHHSENPERLLREMVRVSRQYVLLKDHIADSKSAWRVLALMDWVGNIGYGTPVPFHFFSTNEWKRLYESMGLRLKSEKLRLHLYPIPLTFVLDGNLHFVALLEKKRVEH